MKPGTAKVKGRQTEQALVDYLRDTWRCLYVERRRLNGTTDKGDITGIPGVVIEVKGGGALKVAKWLAELEVEQANANADHGFIAVRPPQQPNPGNWFVVLPLPAMLALLDEAELLPREGL